MPATATRVRARAQRPGHARKGQVSPAAGDCMKVGRRGWWPSTSTGHGASDPAWRPVGVARQTVISAPPAPPPQRQIARTRQPPFGLRDRSIFWPRLGRRRSRIGRPCPRLFESLKPEREKEGSWGQSAGRRPAALASQAGRWCGPCRVLPGGGVTSSSAAAQRRGAHPQSPTCVCRLEGLQADPAAPASDLSRLPASSHQPHGLTRG